jgi:hypothetical protein
VGSTRRASLGRAFVACGALVGRFCRRRLNSRSASATASRRARLAPTASPVVAGASLVCRLRGRQANSRAVRRAGGCRLRLPPRAWSLVASVSFEVRLLVDPTPDGCAGGSRPGSLVGVAAA